jgi:hypothetical protein
MGYTPLQAVLIRLPLCLGALCLIFLPGCTKTIEPEPLQTRIREAVIKQGGLSLKAVHCPDNTPQEVGRSFECVGELDSGDALAIPVRQKDAVGTVEWEVPNAKGLLNLAKIAALFQEAVRTESGQPLIIDCGQGYRSVKPGDRFECKVAQPSRNVNASTNKQAVKTTQQVRAKRPKQPDAIAVAIDSEQNVNWQQVFAAPANSLSATKASASQPNATTTTVAPTQARTNLSTEAARDLDQIVE